jgi:hypothetical protein
MPALSFCTAACYVTKAGDPLCKMGGWMCMSTWERIKEQNIPHHTPEGLENIVKNLNFDDRPLSQEPTSCLLNNE